MNFVYNMNKYSIKKVILWQKLKKKIMNVQQFRYMEKRQSLGKPQNKFFFSVRVTKKYRYFFVASLTWE